MPNVTPACISSDAQAHEEMHVHAVYDQIATHFSSTRYKPWPIIAAFLSNIPAGWVGLDAGTGNGKYLPLDRDGAFWMVGLDRSRNLLTIARTASEGGKMREVVWGDVLGSGWRVGAFDFAISIATIHHLATVERRVLAMQRLLQAVSPSHGRVLIYVWAIEQDELSTRAIPTYDSEAQPSRAGKDVFVPWVISQQSKKPKLKAKLRDARNGDKSQEVEQQPAVFNRYYHMFARGELRELVERAAREMGLTVQREDECAGKDPGRRGVEIVQDGWERSNYFVELRCWQIKT